jgi:hypothetical protein
MMKKFSQTMVAKGYLRAGSIAVEITVQQFYPYLPGWAQPEYRNYNV